MTPSGRALLLLISLPLSGCVAALSEPPALDDLTGVRDEAVDPVALLARAEGRFADREIAAAREAAELWLRAAAFEEHRVEALIGATRARIWLSGHETEKETRLSAAVSAVQTAQWCERTAPDEPSCIYQMALALGVQARERRATGHDALGEMIARLERLTEIAPRLDHAGPHRVLALVLLRAPGWPAGPGDPDLALEFSVNAVNIDRDYPPNQLCLGEALAATDSAQESLRAYESAARLAREWIANGDKDATEWLADAERALARLERP